MTAPQTQIAVRPSPVPVSVPPAAPEPPGERTLSHELETLWQEVYRVQRTTPHVNTTLAATWLVGAERALRTHDGPHTRYLLLKAWYALARAQEIAASTGHRLGAYAVTSLELCYLLAVPAAVLVLIHAAEVSGPALLATKFHLVPVFVLLGGFLGGVAWCLYNAVYWIKNRLFDAATCCWYVVHPWLSALLGGVMALMILGGLSSLGSVSPDGVPSPSLAAALTLVSFAAGFSTNQFWKLLDRTVRKVLGDGGERQSQEQEEGKALHAGHAHAGREE
jgi:hypothetical protein